MYQLTLVPQGGLCNRLRAIASARYLTQHTPQLHVRVAWRVHGECAAEWHNLFTPESWTSPQLRILPAHWSATPVSRHNLHLPALLRRFAGYDLQWKNFHSQLSPQALIESFKGSSKIYISTPYALVPTPTESWSGLQVCGEIADKIAALVKDFPPNTIGLHIRRTDHVMSHRHSPTHLWLSTIDEMLTNEENIRFYLSTDDEALKSYFLSRYPQHILSQNCHGHRSNLLGMQESVIDLFALSHCSRLLGSYWSSFSETAALLGSIPLQTIVTHT